MRRLVCLLAVPLAVACSAGKLAADDLEQQLETDGLASQSVFDARCRDGMAGWHYVCTFRLGRKLSREKAAFIVGRERVERATAVMALDLPVGPGPGEPERAAWSEFVSSANAICGERRLKISRLSAARGGRTGFLPRLAAAARIQSEELTQLAALAPPGVEQARRFDQLLENEQRMIAASARFRAAARRGEVDTARAAAGHVEVTARRLDKLARSLALTRCEQTR
jgi:hypothetical protein